MKALDKILDELRDEMDYLHFNEIIREARSRIGISQCGMAEHLGIPINRLKNLESGFFVGMPRWNEIEAFANFYEIDKKLLEKKADEHVRFKNQAVRCGDC